MSGILSRVYDAAVAVTPSDSVVDPQGPFAGLLVVTAGSGLAFIDNQGNTVTITGTLAIATEIHVACKQVKSTGTGCTVVGLRAMPFKPAVKS